MAFYSEQIIEDVRAANDIIDVISSYVTLKRKGSAYFGLCPFHKEKTGSFAVTPEKQIYHCFGCGEGGNVIKFIMKVENIGFKEAIEFLAERAGITLPAVNYADLNMSQKELIEREESRKQILEINKEAGRFFYKNIEKSQLAKDYLTKRHIDAKTATKFGLGFALDDNGLYKFLLSKGFKEKEMLATGLVGKSESGYLYDKFKNRFMFPIFDVLNRVVAFGGRTLLDGKTMKEQKVPKYVNSPENLLYTKGKHLYGLNVARKSNEKMKRILVVEGYMDVISPHQVGVTNVVASLGTALTEAQGRLLRKYAEEIVLSYDSDDAGQKAIMRGIEIMQSLGVTVKVLQMENAKDPDEYVLKYGKERFEKLIDNSISAVEYKIKNIQKGYNLENISEKIKFLSKLAEVLSKVDSNIERDIYVDKFSHDLNVGKEAIVAEIEKITFKQSSKIKNFEPIKPSINTQSMDKKNLELENMVIYLLTQKDLKVYLKLSEVYSPNDSISDIHKALIKKLYDLYENGDINTKELMSICENDDEINILSEAIIKDASKEDIERLTIDIVRKIEIDKLERKRNEIVKKLENASEDEQKSLWEELQSIIEKLAKRWFEAF